MELPATPVPVELPGPPAPLARVAAAELPVEVAAAELWVRGALEAPPAVVELRVAPRASRTQERMAAACL